MKLFRIKWELILSILLLIASVTCWLTYGFVDTTIQTLSVACMTTFMLTFMVISMKTIETFRHEVLKQWK